MNLVELVHRRKLIELRLGHRNPYFSCWKGPTCASDEQTQSENEKALQPPADAQECQGFYDRNTAQHYDDEAAVNKAYGKHASILARVSKLGASWG